MNVYRLYIAMFRALECLNEEKSSKDLTIYLQDADPYIFKDRHSAIPDVQNDFINKINKKINFNDPKSTYYSILDYLSSKSDFSNKFRNITLEEWNNLLKIIDQECDDEHVLCDSDLDKE